MLQLQMGVRSSSEGSELFESSRRSDNNQACVGAWTFERHGVVTRSEAVNIARVECDTSAFIMFRQYARNSVVFSVVC